MTLLLSFSCLHSELSASGLSKLSDAELQKGIDANLQAMIESFAGRLAMLENLIKRRVNVKTHAYLADGRKIYIRIR